MKNFRLFMTLSILACCLTLFSSCSPEKKEGPTPRPEVSAPATPEASETHEVPQIEPRKDLLKIGILTYKEKNESLKKTMEAVREKDGNVEFTLVSSGLNVEKQIEMMEDMLKKKPDAILLYPLSDAAEDCVLMANKKNIPVFTMYMDVMTRGDVISTVTFDEKLAAEASAEAFQKHLKPPANILILNSDIHKNKNRASKELKELLTKQQYVILETTVVEGPEKKPDEEIPKIFKKYAQLDGIYVTSQMVADAVMKNLTGNKKNTIIISYGGGADIGESIFNDGNIKAAIIPENEKIPEIAVDMVVNYFRTGGRETKKVYSPGVKVIDYESMRGTKKETN